MDALTLLAAVEDARPALADGIVREVFPAGMAGLWFEVATGRGLTSLLIAADEDLPRIARDVPRPPRTRLLSPLAGAARRILPGARLELVGQRGLERIVTFEFAPPFPAPGGAGPAGEGWRRIAELFGAHPNLVLVEAPGARIIEALRHDPPGGGRSFEPGRGYAPPPEAPRQDPLLLRSASALQAALAPHLAAAEGAAAALRLAFAGLTAGWASEVTARARAGTPEALAEALADLLDRIRVGPWSPQLLLAETGEPIGLAPIRLQHLPEDRQRPAASLGEASERLAAHLAARRVLLAGQRLLRQTLHRLENRLRSRQAKLGAESREFARAEDYQRMGEILVAHRSEIPRGAAEASLPDPARGEGSVLQIPLDPAVPLAVNAERLFKAARRGRRGAWRVSARLAETDAAVASVQAWSRRVAAARLPEELMAVQRELLAVPRLLTPHDRTALTSVGALAPTAERSADRREAGAPAPRPKKREAGPAPHRFVSSEGFPILVGRDNEGNDHLTLHLSRSEDLWLHVEGFPGSHVVIRAQNRTAGFPRRTLVEAAQLAAHYSQARNHGKVTVSYTLRKYVRKPRKSPPGLVTITQEKTIVVTPDKALVGKLAVPDEG